MKDDDQPQPLNSNELNQQQKDPVSFRPDVNALEHRMLQLENKIDEIEAQIEDKLMEEVIDASAVETLQEERIKLQTQVRLLSEIILKRRSTNSNGPSSLTSAGRLSPSPLVSSQQQLSQPSTKQVTIPTSLPEWNDKDSSVYDFLRKFENILSAANIDEEHWPKMLRYACRGNVNDDEWVKSKIVATHLSWSAARRLFEERFRAREQRLQ
jgi:hypothetical protein